MTGRELLDTLGFAPEVSGRRDPLFKELSEALGVEGIFDSFVLPKEMVTLPTEKEMEETKKDLRIQGVPDLANLNEMNSGLSSLLIRLIQGRIKKHLSEKHNRPVDFLSMRMDLDEIPRREIHICLHYRIYEGAPFPHRDVQVMGCLPNSENPLGSHVRCLEKALVDDYVIGKVQNDG